MFGRTEILGQTKTTDSNKKNSAPMEKLSRIVNLSQIEKLTKINIGRIEKSCQIQKFGQLNKIWLNNKNLIKSKS